jgi:ubiquinone/menaquinone biosynthesis C-methylase UbiE
MNKNNLNQKAQLNYYNLGSADYEKERMLLTRNLNRATRRKALIIKKKLNAQSSKILEVGAGSGLITYSLTKLLKYKEYTVSDLSKKMLQEAERRLSSPPPQKK